MKPKTPHHPKQKMPKKKYLVMSKRIKQYLNKKGVKLSEDCMDAFDRVVKEKCDQAIAIALGSKRKTVLYRDVLSRSIIIACKALPGYRVYLRFNDGLEGEVCLKHLVGYGVFEPWNDVHFFERVYIDPITHTLTWSDEIDLCADVLRKEIGGKS